MAEKPRELVDFNFKRRDFLRIRTSVSAAADRPASYGYQIISSTRPIAATYICRQSRMGVINIVTDHQMFIPLTGERSGQRLRRSAVDLYSKSEKIALWTTL